VIPERIQAGGLEGTGLQFIHLDVDIEEPTRYVLERFGPLMPCGGIIVVDDYGFTTAPGARRGVDTFLAQHPALFTKFELLTGQCVLVRT
jgi:hypothetical protein